MTQAALFPGLLSQAAPPELRTTRVRVGARFKGPLILCAHRQVLSLGRRRPLQSPRESVRAGGSAPVCVAGIVVGPITGRLAAATALNVIES